MLNLKKRGMRLEDADIFIAAIAIIRELVLVSHDSDMQRVPELTVEDWLVTTT
jgi:tRNA(fMet)-specific endonuclease VapC